MGERVVKDGWKTCHTFGEISSLIAPLNNLDCLIIKRMGEPVFAKAGDSGAVYMVEDISRGLFIPVALHMTSCKDKNGNTYHGGCSIIQCLQKFVQKSTNSDLPPPVDEIMATFLPCDR